MGQILEETRQPFAAMIKQLFDFVIKTNFPLAFKNKGV